MLYFYILLSNVKAPGPCHNFDTKSRLGLVKAFTNAFRELRTRLLIGYQLIPIKKNFSWWITDFSERCTSNKIQLSSYVTQKQYVIRKCET